VALRGSQIRHSCAVWISEFSSGSLWTTRSLLDRRRRAPCAARSLGVGSGRGEPCSGRLRVRGAGLCHVFAAVGANGAGLQTGVPPSAESAWLPERPRPAASRRRKRASSLSPAQVASTTCWARAWRSADGRRASRHGRCTHCGRPKQGTRVWMAPARSFPVCSRCAP
jgi:hypothetical protein